MLYSGIINYYNLFLKQSHQVARSVSVLNNLFRCFWTALPRWSSPLIRSPVTMTCLEICSSVIIRRLPPTRWLICDWYNWYVNLYRLRQDPIIGWFRGAPQLRAQLIYLWMRKSWSKYLNLVNRRIVILDRYCLPHKMDIILLLILSLYVYIYIYIYICVCVYVCIYIYVCVCVCMYI